MNSTVDAAGTAVDDCDVVVIGGGPAGSTIAALLARQQRRVVLLEKAFHPRFHIGESLLPGNAELFDRLGVREQVEQIGMPKWGIEFVSPDHDHRSYLEFADAWDKSQPYSWQVRRSDMDELLFRNAAARGAVTIEGCHVRKVEFDADGATVEADIDGGKRRWRTAFVVDASGRDTLLANKLRCKQKNPRHASSALFGHYSGARRLEGRKQGNISIMWFEHGWFWFIPLADGTTSVGVVCWPSYLKTRSKPLAEFFADTVAMCPELADRLKDARLVGGEIHATGNYSYSADHATGDRYLLLGDAYTFIDPMFSSGVYLAMRNAFDAVDVIDARLDQPTRAAAARKRYETLVRKGPEAFSWFIFRVTNPTIRHLFMYPANPLRVKEALLALLAGDLYGKSPIQPSLWALKAIYYMISIGHLGRSFRGWRLRQSRLREDTRQPRCHDDQAMTKSGFSISVAIACLAAGNAGAEQRPLWELGVGAGALRLPHYRGSDQSHNWLLPVPYVIYRGRILKADRDGARAVLFASERVHFDLSLAASAPTRSSDNLARQGMPDLVPTVELGPNLNLRLADGPGWKLEFRAPVRAALTVESNPRSIGWIATPNLNLDLRRGNDWNIGMQVGVQIAERRFNAFFYDVDASQATATRPAYRSAGGFGGTRWTLAASRRFDNHWFGAFARFDDLSGARFGNSPLVRRRSHLSFGVAAAWVFGRSTTMVTVDE